MYMALTLMLYIHDRSTPKPIVSVNNLSELAWCAAEGWISNLSQYSSLHLDCWALKAVDQIHLWGGERLGVRGSQRKSEKEGVGDRSGWQWMNFCGVERWGMICLNGWAKKWNGVEWIGHSQPLHVTQIRPLHSKIYPQCEIQVRIGEVWSDRLDTLLFPISISPFELPGQNWRGVERKVGYPTFPNIHLSI
ncbi:hypothetical protein AVEN_140553-1 [Araneus ventricosus]|uniref:Uncharacterized protein n=1 Tax=Araneus ventricosus TaxID=182803 RepID=A0A4Y2IS72_ARAVE|nr:hypothetical protein AVEN_140553-1 [Araneus ventricosus]